MNIIPELYNNSNFLQQRDGQQLINRISDDYKDKHVSTIVDIGCGTGNITIELTRKLKHDKIIAVDLSESMIEYATKNYDYESVDYVVADFCSNWQQLKRVNSLLAEDSVDIVMSVYCLHWVSDTKTAMDNISKLLKPGGKCYVLLFSWSDLLPKQQELTLYPKWKRFFEMPSNVESKESLMASEKSLKGKERKLSGLPPFQVFDKPNEQQVKQKWQDLCNDCGLTVLDIAVTRTYYPFNDTKSLQNELQALCHLLPAIPEEYKKEFLGDYFKLVEEGYVSTQKRDELESETSDKKSVILGYDYITFVAEK